MTAQMTETAPARTTGEYPAAREIDQSCRWPVALLFTGSVVWLVLGLLAGVLASVKMHAPGMFADVAALTYGRIAAASSSLLLYGFLSQAGLGAALWLFARMGRTRLALPGAAVFGALVWNAGVLAGVAGTLCGGMTHHAMYQMPAWSSVIFFAAFVILGLSGLLTFVSRAEKELYPSNWFLLAAFFVFPWILAVAYLMLGRYGVRGPMEPVVATWYANNFLMMWLAPLALGVMFYFIAKLSKHTLHSRPLAVFGFWFYVLLAHMGGFQNTPGLPNWMPALSSVANVLLLLPMLAIAFNWGKTCGGKTGKSGEPAAKYIIFSTMAFLAWALLLALLACPLVDQVVGLTIFVQGASFWALMAFAGMAFFAALVYILPRLLDVEWPSAKLAGMHFSLTVVGLVLVSLGLLFGGYLQGRGWNDPSMQVGAVVKRVVPLIGISTLGYLALLAGQVLLLANVGLMIKAACMQCCGCGGKEAA